MLATSGYQAWAEQPTGPSEGSSAGLGPGLSAARVPAIPGAAGQGALHPLGVFGLLTSPSPATFPSRPPGVAISTIPLLFTTMSGKYLSHFFDAYQSTV